MARFSMKRKVNISRVVAKLAGTVIALYVGNQIMGSIGTIMTGKSSAFYKGFSLIGWTVADVTNKTGLQACTSTPVGTGVNVANCITSATGSGILTIIGIVGIASIVMEFVQFKL